MNQPPAAAAAPAVKPVQSGTKADNDLVALIAYTNWLRNSNPTQLQRLLPDAEARTKDPGSALDRLRLAIMLSLPQAPFRNEARALALVDEIVRDPAQHDTDLVMFGYMLRWDLQDRHLVQTDCERLLAQERHQRAALKQKLNELKAIEEQIHRRETVTPSTTTP